MPTRGTAKEVRKALRTLCDAIGNQPAERFCGPNANNHRDPVYVAWSAAVDLLDGPDEFNERFRAQHEVKP